MTILARLIEYRVDSSDLKLNDNTCRVWSQFNSLIWLAELKTLTKHEHRVIDDFSRAMQTPSYC